MSETLDEAWAAAEAALPEPGYISLSGPFGRTMYGPYVDHYNASAWLHGHVVAVVDKTGVASAVYPIAGAHGPTPAAALRNLAANLRAAARPTRDE